MAIFGFKKRKDEKLEQNAEAAKVVKAKGVKRAQKKGPHSAETASRGKEGEKKAIALPTVSGKDTNVASVILRPRITEKSGILSQEGKYTFEVTKNANKPAVTKAITALYKVNPVHVTMVNTPVRNVFVRGKKGTVPGIRKAIVTLKKGEKIDFV